MSNDNTVIPFAARTRLRHRQMVLAVPVELLAEAAGRYVVKLERHGEDTADVHFAAGMTIRRLRDTRPIDELGLLGVNLGARLAALVNFLAGQCYAKDDGFAALRGGDAALLRAAALAPLNERGEGEHWRFELATFLAIVQGARMGSGAA